MRGPKRFRKKPVVIEAMQWDGTNEDAIAGWTDGGFRVAAGQAVTAELYVAANSRWLPVVTGEWVLRDAAGFYPCKPDIFEATYEEVKS